MPIALAILLTFVLTPPVTWLQRMNVVLHWAGDLKHECPSGRRMQPDTNFARLQLIASLALVIAAFGTPAYAQARNVTLQFMAPDANWGDRSLTGHAFICIQRKTGRGVSEDCFGFYLRKSGKTLVGGPGVIDHEFDFSKTPLVRFTHVKASVTAPITVARRQRLLSFIRGFDKDFSPTPANCISFANGVARLAGLKTPRSTSLTPLQYVNELRKLNPS